MLETISALGIGLTFLLGGCAIAAVLGTGRGERQPEAMRQPHAAPLSHPATWRKAS